MRLFSGPLSSSQQQESVPIRIAIVDDDDGVRTKLGQAVARFAGCACVGEYCSGEEALSCLPAAAPDVVLMDINLPGISGIECVRQIKAAHPEIEFIMLTVYKDTESVFNALAAGATGYLLKLATRQELREAIRLVHAGGSPMSSHIARKVVQSFCRPALTDTVTTILSPREQQVLEYLAKGFLYKEISDAMDISYDTVHSHIRRIYEKLHVRSRTQAVTKYLSSVHPAARPIP